MYLQKVEAQKGSNYVNSYNENVYSFIPNCFKLIIKLNWNLKKTTYPSENPTSTSSCWAGVNRQSLHLSLVICVWVAITNSTFISSVCLLYFEFHVNWSNVNDHLILKCKIKSKGKSEFVNRKTDNTMAKRK
jgi:hypothetical protein